MTAPNLVFITGASGGFGSAFARRFAALGSNLILAGRNRGKLETLAASLGVPCHLAIFDMGDRAAMTAAMKTLPPEFQAVDLLINNAGLALGLGPAQEADMADWDAMIATNVSGLAAMTRAILPGMIARGRGHIVNISSVAASYPYPGGHVYCASKAFVSQFSLALRADLVATPIRVTSIEPGMVETDFSLVRFKGDAARAAGVYAGTTPLTAEDVAESVVWCATLPPHMNINRIELMPVSQAPGPLVVHRTA